MGEVNKGGRKAARDNTGTQQRLGEPFFLRPVRISPQIHRPLPDSPASARSGFLIR
jgi:hypothetical protein